MSPVDRLRKEIAQGFSLPALFGLFILLEALALVIYPAHALWRGKTNLRTFWFVDAAFLQTVVLAASLYLRPRILCLSQIRLRWEHLAWLLAGLIFNCIPIRPVPDPLELSAGVPMWLYFFILCVYIPVLEELLSKGVFLRSLLFRTPRIAAIVCVALLTSVEHSNFWQALPLQCLLCIVYVYRQNSLSASAACHVGANIAALVFFSKHV